jgi:long-chain acyl-CoA synthetase
MAESPFIEQIMVVGSGEKFTGALIVPSFKALGDWCREQGISDTARPSLICNEKVQRHMQSVIGELNTHFNNYEQIKKFELLETEWSVDGGELTPKLSLRRKVIAEKYKYSIEKIYNR